MCHSCQFTKREIELDASNATLKIISLQLYTSIKRKPVSSYLALYVFCKFVESLHFNTVLCMSLSTRDNLKTILDLNIYLHPYQLVGWFTLKYLGDYDF